MVILKADLGFMLDLSPDENYMIRRLSYKGCHRELSMVRGGELEVCEVIELQEINWDYVDWPGLIVYYMLLISKI